MFLRLVMRAKKKQKQNQGRNGFSGAALMRKDP